MKIKRPRSFAVLIPSKGRPEELLKTLRTMPFLHRPSTYIGIEVVEAKAYAEVRKAFPQMRWIRYENPVQSGTLAREQLRQVATTDRYDRYVLSDDNTRFSEQSLENLVRASFVFPLQPCIVAGIHGTAEHFDSERIKQTLTTHGGLRFYKKRSAMFWVLPHEFYTQMKYTIDRGCMDDVQVTFAAFDYGIDATRQVVCMDAPFQKTRYKPGGYGSVGERAWKVGVAIQRFATTHPRYMEKVRMTFPWTQIDKVSREKE